MFDEHICFNFYGLPLNVHEENRASYIECECGSKALKNRKEKIYSYESCGKKYFFYQDKFQLISKNKNS